YYRICEKDVTSVIHYDEVYKGIYGGYIGENNIDHAEYDYDFFVTLDNFDNCHLYKNKKKFVESRQFYIIQDTDYTFIQKIIMTRFLKKLLVRAFQLIYNLL